MVLFQRRNIVLSHEKNHLETRLQISTDFNTSIIRSPQVIIQCIVLSAAVQWMQIQILEAIHGSNIGPTLATCCHVQKNTHIGLINLYRSDMSLQGIASSSKSSCPMCAIWHLAICRSWRGSSREVPGKSNITKIYIRNTACRVDVFQIGLE